MTTIKWLTWPVLGFGLALLSPARALGHCDGLDGPVVKAAQSALELGPAIPAADKALETGAIMPVQKLLAEAMQGSLLEHFNEAIAAKAFNAGDVTAGREYVKAYIAFLHYVERLYEASITSPEGHIGETADRLTGGLN